MAITTAISQLNINQTVQNATAILDDLGATVPYGTTISDFNITVPWVEENDVPLSTKIMFGLTCFLTLLGLFGNSLILAVMIKIRDQALKPHDILISALALFDGLALPMSAISHPSVYAVLGTDIRAITTAGCKLFLGLQLSLTICSYTVIVLICVERFIVVWWPLRARYILTRRLVIRALCTSVIVICLLYITMPVLYSQIVDGKCDPNIGGTVYSTVLNEIPDTTVCLGILVSHMGLYLAVLFILTPIIIVKLYKAKQIRQQLTTPEQNIGHFKTTVKLAFVLVSFIVLAAIPGALFAAIGRSGVEITDESQSLISWLILARLLQRATNFLLYNTFDIKFRADVLSLFHIETVPLMSTNAEAGAEMLTLAGNHNLAMIEAIPEAETSVTVTENQTLVVSRVKAESETSLKPLSHWNATTGD